MQRRQYEDVFVEQISKDDVTGIAGYTVMPNAEDYDDKNEIRAAVQKTAVDAALIARFLALITIFMTITAGRIRQCIRLDIRLQIQ